MQHQQVYTIGVEEEYQIIEPLTRDLSPSVVLLLQKARSDLGEAVQYEMLLSQIEVTTPVCSTLSKVREHLTRVRGSVIAAARAIEKQIVAAGTHPFAAWEQQRFSPGERYASLLEHYQQLAYEQTIFACHVHIGLADRHEALQTMNQARGWLAPILALTGNSPFFQNADTGYASYRTMLWARWPVSGPPPLFSSLTEHDELISTLTDLDVIESARAVYWDMRLSARFPTIEVRVADVCSTLEETVMLAGLIRALIQTCHQHVLQGKPAPSLQPAVLRASHWQAARYGMQACVIDPLSGQIVPVNQVLDQLLHVVRPVLEAQGDWEGVSRTIEAIRQRGTGADRQRAVYQQTGQFQQVIDFLVNETARGISV